MAKYFDYCCILIFIQETFNFTLSFLLCSRLLIVNHPSFSSSHMIAMALTFWMLAQIEKADTEGLHNDVTIKLTKYSLSKFNGSPFNSLEVSQFGLSGAPTDKLNDRKSLENCFSHSVRLLLYPHFMMFCAACGLLWIFFKITAT